MFIIVETDDMRPSMIPMWEKYWDPLKSLHPELQVTCFVPAFSQEFGLNEAENIETSKDFKEWYRKRKKWVTIALHGYDHAKPPEYLRERSEQIDSITKSLRVLEPYIDDDIVGFKAPFYRIKDTTISILKGMGVNWYCQWWHYIPLNIIKKPLPQYVVLGTHTNCREARNPDNIDLVHEKLSLSLFERESLGFKYSNFNDLMRGVLL